MRRASDRPFKEVANRLRVNAWTPSGFLLAGTLDLEEDGPTISATFQYDPGYLTAPGAYPLDPINLPLGRTLYATSSQFVTLGAIFDAAPDAWGRRVVAAQIPPTSTDGIFRSAFLRGADGIGSLVLTPESLSAPTDLDNIVSLSLNERPTLTQIERAARAAADFEDGQDLTDEMRHMLGGSWTIGGARPKAILRDDRRGAAPGSSLIAKFNSKRDLVPRNRIEWACMQMASDMGFRVAKADLVELGNDGDSTALVLERFDRELVAGRIHRRHYVSAISLASYEPQSAHLNSSQDQIMISWGKLLEIASRVSDKPAPARVEMFSRLVLNTALQNTDDHLKNFGFIKVDGAATRYDIAPVFDVSAQAATRHYLHCANLGQVYAMDEVIPMARRLGIANGAAEEIEQRILTVLDQRKHYLDRAGLSASQAGKVLGWIESGLGSKYASRAAPEHAASDTTTEDSAEGEGDPHVDQ
jgi:serine/threonine-protein kinase HipA